MLQTSQKERLKSQLRRLDVIGIGNLQDRLNDVRYVVVTHLAVDRQRNLSLVFCQGHWKIVGAITVRLDIVRVQMQGNKMNADANVARAQFVNKLSPVRVRLALDSNNPFKITSVQSNLQRNRN